jgi:hypothetical protein
MNFVCVVEVSVTASYTKILSATEEGVYGKFISLAKVEGT